ncbi:zinc-binding dehydrogenase [Leucobacter sp. GX24907]
MWQYYQPAPTEFARIETEAPQPSELVEGEVLIRFRAGAICGSDVPKYLGHIDSDNLDTGHPGAPLHEAVGIIESSRDDALQPGQRVVGIIKGSRGLSEVIRNPGWMLVPVDDRLDDVAATVIQPVSTVLSTLSHATKLQGARVAVLGLGPLGLLFTHVAKALGAAHVIGVDRVDRSDVAERFGIDEVVRSDVRSWAENLDPTEAPDLVIEAIGHRQEYVVDAVEAVRDGGQLILFGLPEDHYVFPMRKFFRKNLTLWAGTTRDWQKYLREAQAYLFDHPELVRDYVTDVFPVDRVDEAFRSYAAPRKGRIKVALTPPA